MADAAAGFAWSSSLSRGRSTGQEPATGLPLGSAAAASASIAGSWPRRREALDHGSRVMCHGLGT